MSVHAPLLAAGAGNHMKRSLLIIGGQFSGTFVARELKTAFDVTLVDAKEYMEYTPGILRAFVKPSHFEALSFLLEPVLVRKVGIKFLIGEVKKLSYDGQRLLADILPLGAGPPKTLPFDYCIICAGCNFGPFHKWGESLWFPTIHEDARRFSDWGEIDERYHQGRKHHILKEHQFLKALNAQGASVLVVGAGFIGVEWVTELQYYFNSLNLTIIDVLPRCLGPLPDAAATYCTKYMASVGIKQLYNLKFDARNQAFWDGIGLPMQADKTYVCIGVKASNYFMPAETLSDKGPGGGGWIHFNLKLQVTSKPLEGEAVGATWAAGRAFAVGDCNYGCIGNPPDWIIPPIPKVSFPGEEQACHACENLRLLDEQLFGDSSRELRDTWWPWGAGMFATSLGPRDACFVLGATHEKGSGWMLNWWWPAAIQKDLLEKTKLMECKSERIGRMVWHFVHHRPIVG